MSRALVAHAVAAVLMIATAGCRADGPDGPGELAASIDEDVSGRVLRPSEEVQFTASEFEFMPGELIAEEGAYSGELINEGSIKHNLTFSNGESFDVEPGESVPIEFSVLGEDVIYTCAIAGHEEAGMTGVIHTRETALIDETEDE